MHWWPLAATVSAAFFVVSLGALFVAPAIDTLCGREIVEPGTCEGLMMGARSLVVGSGALLAAALVAGLYTVMLRIAAKPREDARPLVSIHARRRH